MVFHPLPTVKTGSAGGFDHGLEIPVIRVAQHLGEVAAGPVFVARRVGAADVFKGGDLVAHDCSNDYRKPTVQSLAEDDKGKFSHPVYSLALLDSRSSPSCLNQNFGLLLSCSTSLCMSDVTSMM
jgi:hypothetical protein